MFTKIKKFFNENSDTILNTIIIGGTVVLGALVVIATINSIKATVNQEPLYGITLRDTRDGSITNYIVNEKQLREVEAAERAYAQSIEGTREI